MDKQKRWLNKRKEEVMRKIVNIGKDLDLKQIDTIIEEAIEKAIEEAIEGMRAKEKERKKKKGGKGRGGVDTDDLAETVGKGGNAIKAALGNAYDKAVALTVLAAVLSAFNDVGEKLDYDTARKLLIAAIIDFRDDIIEEMKIFEKE